MSQLTFCFGLITELGSINLVDKLRLNRRIGAAQYVSIFSSGKKTHSKYNGNSRNPSANSQLERSQHTVGICLSDIIVNIFKCSELPRKNENQYLRLAPNRVSDLGIKYTVNWKTH